MPVVYDFFNVCEGPTGEGRSRAPARRVRDGRSPAIAQRARDVRPGGLLDLREREGVARVRTLRYPAGDILVVSGLPGGGKSTLMRRGAGARLIGSQDVRLRWERRTSGLLPYAAYRPLVRIAHYAGLWQAVRSGASVVVHGCGTGGCIPCCSMCRSGSPGRAG
jgi:hypothetical protein